MNGEQYFQSDEVLLIKILPLNALVLKQSFSSYTSHCKNILLVHICYVYGNHYGFKHIFHTALNMV